MVTTAIVVVLLIVNAALWVVLVRAVHRVYCLQRFYRNLIRDMTRAAHVDAAPPDLED